MKEWSARAAGRLAVGLVVLETFIGLLSYRQPDRGWVWFIGTNAGLLLLAEGVMRGVHRLKTGEPYKFTPKPKLEQSLFEPHPYLSLAPKKKFATEVSPHWDYPFHRDSGLSMCRLRTNNFRHFDGPDGDRPIEVPKPFGQYRVLCLGASTTMNYICDGHERYSYPMELEKLLCAQFPARNIVVHNCGQGGWTSADILIDFVLNLYATQPDAVILYHGYNDLAAGLAPGFETDYSHYRRNFGEISERYRWASFVPDIPLASYNFLVNSAFPLMNPRHGLLEALTKTSPSLSAPFAGIETYARNIEHIVKLCRASAIDVVLSSFANFIHDEIKESPVHSKYHEGVILENDSVRRVATKYNVAWVDQFRLIPSDERYFVDSIHFSPEGMKLLAANFASEVSKILANRDASTAALC